MVQLDNPDPLVHRVYLVNEAPAERVVYQEVKVNQENKVKWVRKDPVDQQASRVNAVPMDLLDQLVDLAVPVHLGSEARPGKSGRPERPVKGDLRA